MLVPCIYFSEADIAEPVTITVDIGALSNLVDVEISWGCLAKAFSVALRADGVSLTDVCSTDANAVYGAKVALGGQIARSARLGFSC